MKEKKLQVFVSSTYTDLIEERQAAVEAILSSGNIPAGMELFSAGDESQMTVIERWIDESDVYLLILGGRYGSIDSKTGKSYTQLEYEYAIEKSKPLFAVVINEKALEEKMKLRGSEVIEKENQKELKEFRVKVMKNLVKIWDDKKDIKLAIHETLSEFSYSKELKGWIRGDNAINTSVVAEEIAKLTKENSDLRNQLAKINDNALYFGLNYDQLELILKNQAIGEDENLFNFLRTFGNEITSVLYFDLFKQNQEERTRIEILEKLKILKIVQKQEIHSALSYSFTEDGHNFYLKTLALSLKNS